MKKDLSSIIEKIKSSALDQFDGLSPNQMYDFLDTEKASSIFILNQNNNSIDEIPIIRQIRYFLNRVEAEGEAKLTKTGNLSPTLVKELYSQRILFDDEIETGITKLTKESDSHSIILTRSLSELSGLLKKKGGSLSLTSKAKRIFTENILFPLIFNTFANVFNWSYFDGYSNQSVGQAGYRFSLFLLCKYGNIERETDFYADKYFTAFPHLLTQSSNRNSESYKVCYALRTFSRFLDYFGFIDLSEESPGKLKIKKSKTFDQFISFKIRGV